MERLPRDIRKIIIIYIIYSKYRQKVMKELISKTEMIKYFLDNPYNKNKGNKHITNLISKPTSFWTISKFKVLVPRVYDIIWDFDKLKSEIKEENNNNIEFWLKNEPAIRVTDNNYKCINFCWCLEN